MSTKMLDPLSDVINLLQPRAIFSKGISGAGNWSVRYSEFGQPSFCAVLDGSCLLAVDNHEPVALEKGDFVLLPATPGFTMSSFEYSIPKEIDPFAVIETEEEIRHGDPDLTPNVRLLGGYFEFDSPDAAILVSLLPSMIHVHGNEKLASLVEFVRDESNHKHAGKELILTRYVEILLIEALRVYPTDSAPAGLLRGLSDERISLAIRLMHSAPSRPWTMNQLAKMSAMSRSAFFNRFSKLVGCPPMEYLLAWRMAIAKNLLAKEDKNLTVIAEKVGYGSASAFSTAFSRYVGTSPSLYTQNQMT